jgi:hypothetical protein
MNPDVSETKLKCVNVMIFEEKGKTILQPILRGQDAQSVHELFQKGILEVWLPNGRSELAQFNVFILKYKQIDQPSKMCSKVKNRTCLKNHFETIISCEQCPISNEEPQTQNGKGHSQLPNLSLQLRRQGRLRRLGSCST